MEGNAVCFIMSDTYCSQFQYIYFNKFELFALYVALTQLLTVLFFFTRFLFRIITWTSFQIFFFCAVHLEQIDVTNQLLYSEYILLYWNYSLYNYWNSRKKYMYQISPNKITCLILYLFLSSYPNSFDLSGHGQGTPEGCWWSFGSCGNIGCDHMKASTQNIS